MLKILRVGASDFESPTVTDAGWSLPADAVWVELVEPSRAEELAVEAQLGMLLPTREEMEEIEPSSRLYQEGGATVMTAMVLYNAESEQPSAGPVTFVLAGSRLVTIRYFEPRSFKVFAAQALRQPHMCADGPQTFIGLIDAIVDRTADVLERVQGEVEEISRSIFNVPTASDFASVLNRLGRSQGIIAKLRESLVSLARLSSFAGLADQIGENPEHRDHLASASADVHSLLDHATFVSSNIVFLHDAALGQINLQQSNVVKIFSVAAVAFLPPTLVASIYGMNFEFMPELSWRYGYPFAVGLMFLSIVIPLWFFRRKGWL